MSEHTVSAVVRATKAGRVVFHSPTCKHGGEIVREDHLPVRTALTAQKRDVADCLANDAISYANRLETVSPGEGYALYR